jgi:hypothetical protein
MPNDTVTLIVSEGARFGYNGRTYIEGDPIELPAEHADAWLERGLVERPRTAADWSDTPGG